MDGRLPTRKELEEFYEFMEEYAAVFSDGDERWEKADRNARDIDNYDGVENDAERAWRPTPTQKRGWTHRKVKGVELVVEHPRRFCRVDNHRKQMENAIIGLRERLRACNDDHAIVWSVNNYGWTTKPKKRRRDHYNHKGTDHIVKK